MDEAEAYAHKAIKILRLNGNQTGLGIAYHGLGYILSLRENFAEAARAFETAVSYERSASAKLDLGHSLHSLGNMYLNMMQLDKAQACLEESLQIKESYTIRKG
ncbi:MAG: tetratricopeptide repeat protein [Saprospirales bacterium]|nr:tetratricopeptide repeat protein [Saprospirales bacterium]